ncbi:MAG: hypothetical protein Q8922_05195 [Bacteroidota bacterium]|nr:hypothetical protein [Bacteroidota bacterium]MDP4231903.1 hypothetical protein [Bacteroidota bacterium]MDP4241390.1 hypothetical protein [Bacteroidota bacterium]MDP4287313.1 hypothetical protein [Bacteroidota bacterium]
MQSQIRLNVLLVLALALVAGCSFPNHAERKYLASIYGSSPNIHVPRAQFDTAWSRAKRFVSTYSSQPVLVANDSLITTDTSKPSYFSRLFSPYIHQYPVCKITAHQISDGVLIKTHCWDGSHKSEILVDYIKTGLLPYPELIDR